MSRLATEEMRGSRCTSQAGCGSQFVMRSPFRDIAAVSAARVYGMLLSLFTLFVSARYLGPEGRGAYAAAIAWATLFATFANLSLGQALQYRIQHANYALSLSKQIGTLGGLGLLLSFGALLVAFIGYVVTGGALFKGLDSLLLCIAFSAVPLLIWEQFSNNILAAASRLDILNRAQYIGRTFGLVAFFGLVGALSLGIAGALTAQLLGLLVIAVVVLHPLLRMAGKPPSMQKAEVIPLLSAGAKVHLTTVSALLLDQVGVLLINNYLTKAYVGYYQLSQQMVSIMLILPQSALMVVYGGIAGSDPDKYWPQQRKLAIKVLGVMLAGALLAFVLSPYLIRALAGERFEPSVEIFQWLLPTLVGQTLAILMTPQWISRGLFFVNNLLTVTTAILVVGASWVLIPQFGVEGAIWVRLAVYAGLVTVVQLVFWYWCNAAGKSVRF